MLGKSREATASRTSCTDAMPNISKRKHRAGLQRVAVACERCRSRKNKCDKKIPECSACKAAGAVCIVVDRMTNHQYPRGHVEALEAEVARLKARVRELELELEASKDGPSQVVDHSVADTGIEKATPISIDSPIISVSSSASPFENIAEHLSVVSRDVTSGRRYVGDSSGLFFGNIVQGVLLHADYKGEQGPSTDFLRFRVADRLDGSKTHVPPKPSPVPSQFEFPDIELAHRLQDAYFTHRWPALPFMHKPSFLEHHFAPTLALQNDANDVSLFLTLMVFALGAIDIKRQKPTFGDKHLEYFKHATRYYLQGLLEEDSVRTVQGLLLIAQFAINENQSANAWLVTGQAVRIAIDLGLHRSHAAFLTEADSMSLEMRKRVFWSAYALDRNVSITLGRPCALRDEDIDIPLPRNLADEDLLPNSTHFRQSSGPSNQPYDMSTFIHIIKLRQLQSKIQALFYSADTSRVHSQGVLYHQAVIRSQLDEWIAQSPRYSHPTMATFQSMEWFQIAYSHALLLLYRPSPANPVIDPGALQICSDSSISLISSYSSLYAKNKITYTWIALHSLFMASITMLYALFVSATIRENTTKAVVKSNIVSCLALFEVMAEHWPLAVRCHDIIGRLGSATVALFDAPESTSGEFSVPTFEGGIRDNRSSGQRCGQIDAEFMEWFGTRKTQNSSSFPELRHSIKDNAKISETTSGDFIGTSLSFSGDIDLDLGNIEDLFPAGIDTTIPMMMSVFANESHAPMLTPRPPDASDVSINNLPNI